MMPESLECDSYTTKYWKKKKKNYQIIKNYSVRYHSGTSVLLPHVVLLTILLGSSLNIIFMFTKKKISLGKHCY